ncbi:integrase core domain-containing protein [Kitasatospora atroaurantiaca]|uniref:integrase core domain-containing protein n=1 Tax=Kitasatospora atroaurantiaca TaxID=285545 RepID=UPI003CCC5D3E
MHRHRFATRADARLKIATWITGFYNTRRRHSAAGGLPPVEFERIISEARSRTRRAVERPAPSSTRARAWCRPRGARRAGPGPTQVVGVRSRR